MKEIRVETEARILETKFEAETWEEHFSLTCSPGFVLETQARGGTMHNEFRPQITIIENVPDLSIGNLMQAVSQLMVSLLR